MTTMKDITDEVRQLCEPDPRTTQEKFSAEIDELHAEVEYLKAKVQQQALDVISLMAQAEAQRDRLRDRFACDAMKAQIIGVEGVEHDAGLIGELAAFAYKVADAMLAAREVK